MLLAPFKRFRQSDLTGGTADQYLKTAGFNRPLIFFWMPERNIILVDRMLYLLLFTGFQEHLLKALQLLIRSFDTGTNVLDVKLCHVRTGHFTHVFDRICNRQ